MSKFQVLVKRVAAIEPHPKADRLEFVVVEGFRSLVPKGSRAVGDLVAYIPEASTVTPFILKRLGLWDDAAGKGKCAGEAGLRVKAVRLQGLVSQGLIYPASKHGGQWFLPACRDGQEIELEVREGQEVAAELGIEKYKVPVPAELQGQAFDPGIEHVPHFDVEDFKWHPDALAIGEEVVMTEKLHGTFLGCSLLEEPLPDGTDFLAYSKGTAAQGMAFYLAAASPNPYVRAVHAFDLKEKLRTLRGFIQASGIVNPRVFAFFEIIGSASLQDLQYGQGLGLRIHAAGVGGRSDWSCLDRDVFENAATAMGVETAPLIYRGPFSRELLEQHTNGKETLSGEGLHIREGVVVTPAKERYLMGLGRVCLKSVSPNYVSRGGNATEYN